LTRLSRRADRPAVRRPAYPRATGLKAADDPGEFNERIDAEILGWLQRATKRAA
jgi:hypothetical protein